MRKRHSYKDALAIAKDFIRRFIESEYTIAGSLRRREETIGDVDIITLDKMNDISERLRTDILARKINGGSKKMDVNFRGIRFNLYHSELGSWGSFLMMLTGPKGYTIGYRRRAKARGWKLDQYGLWNEHGEIIASRTEEQIYKALGKSYKPPELRGK